MSYSAMKQGGTQSSTYGELQEHAEISGVGGKKVFIVDSSGNQVDDFGNRFATSDIDEASATLVYICKIDADGAWLILKIDSSSNPNSFTYASVLNNPTVTDYDSAFTDRASLTYGKYNQAL